MTPPTRFRSAEQPVCVNVQQAARRRSACRCRSLVSRGSRARRPRARRPGSRTSSKRRSPHRPRPLPPGSAASGDLRLYVNRVSPARHNSCVMVRRAPGLNKGRNATRRARAGTAACSAPESSRPDAVSRPDQPDPEHVPRAKSPVSVEVSDAAGRPNGMLRGRGPGGTRSMSMPSAAVRAGPTTRSYD